MHISHTPPARIDIGRPRSWKIMGYAVTEEDKCNMQRAFEDNRKAWEKYTVVLDRWLETDMPWDKLRQFLFLSFVPLRPDSIATSSAPTWEKTLTTNSQ